MKRKINVKNIEIVLFERNKVDYISLTDIARFKNQKEPKDAVKNWMRRKETIYFLGIWEKLYNPNFKGVEFDAFKNEAGFNYFTMSPSLWINATGAIGIVSKAGKAGGTYAHKDIAFEFASWISAEFKLYLIKEFQRLKEDESERLSLGWDLRRNLARINYRIHTDAIKENLIPVKIGKIQESIIYASEADVLNVALFGMTAKDWRDNNPKRGGNIRDYSTVEQLVCLTNLESLNAMLIKRGMAQKQRLQILNETAISQMRTLVGSKGIERLK